MILSTFRRYGKQWIMTRDQNSQDAFCCCCSAAQLCPTLCKPMDYSMLGFPSITISQSLLKLMFTEMVMPPNHLILRHPLLLLLPSIFSSIRVFSNESVFHIRWPKHWSFSFSTSPDIINLLWILQMPASILEISKRFFYYLFVKFLSIQGFAPKIGTFIKYQRKDNFKPQEIFL